MVQTLDECVSRLQQMASEDQQTWDLSPNDQEAIRLAVRVLSVVQYLDEMPAFVNSHPLAGGGMALVAGIREVEAESHLSAFSIMGESFYE
jgi:hypothetical protein